MNLWIVLLNIVGGVIMDGAREYTKVVSEPWFTLIRLGLKTVEGRLKKGEFDTMRVGDKIRFVNGDLGFRREVDVVIKGITCYSSFNDYLWSEGLEKTLPGAGIRDIGEALSVYYKYYTKEEEKKYGVIAIKFIRI